MVTDALVTPQIEALAVGAVIDNFRLLEPINAGGTAYLFRVEPVGGARYPFPLVMKVPRVGVGQPSESILGFETESMVLAALSGDYVPRFVAAGDLVKMPHLTMEWIDGTGLSKLMAQRSLRETEICSLGSAIADAVHALHQQHTIHHDIKPDNISIRADGRAVLLDFGFAHHAHLPDLLAEERRYAAGSAPYISPEQLNGSRGDTRSDLFALGVVLYEMATGEFPFGVPENVNEMRNRLWVAPVPPRVRNAEISPALQEIILRAIDPDPHARYQTAAHIAFDLRHLEQVRITERATRNSAPGFWSQLQRWWRSRDERVVQQRKPIVNLSQSPIIMVAVDTSHPDDVRHPALQWTAHQLATLNLEFRLICVTAIRAEPTPAFADAQLTASASGRQLAHKVQLRHWIEPLGLPADRVSLHVLESDTPADALLSFARCNNVDLIVIGASSPDDARLAWWRSTASAVTAQAHCSVHVVRVPTRPREDWQPKQIASQQIGG